jgi:hypothetical protein
MGADVDHNGLLPRGGDAAFLRNRSILTRGTDACP